MRMTDLPQTGAKGAKAPTAPSDRTLFFVE
jgi:hypothetical protein